MVIRFLGILILLFVVSCSTVRETPSLSSTDDPGRVVWDGYFLDLYFKNFIHLWAYGSVASYRNVLVSELTGLSELDNALKKCDSEINLFDKVIDFQYRRVKSELKVDSVQFKQLIVLFNQPKVRDLLSKRRDLFDPGTTELHMVQEYKLQRDALSEILEAKDLSLWNRGSKAIWLAMKTIMNKNSTQNSVNVFGQEQLSDAYESNKCQLMFSLMGG
ncbi:MAG: hypothetical protein ACRBHB_09055 [Arenicella sp.]